MKERPMLFSGEMVRAIMDGRKTQTRRNCKDYLQIYDTVFSYKQNTEFDFHRKDGVGQIIKCPYGQPGDRLWVRETHYVQSAGYPDGKDRFILYKATDLDSPVSKWTPSIHMPRWASRITLEITNVRVERLQDISEDDAKSEGPCQHPDYPDNFFTTWEAAFKFLWNKINGPGAWDKNPWVWVIEFKRV